MINKKNKTVPEFISGLLITVLIWGLFSVMINKTILPGPMATFMSLIQLLSAPDVYVDILISVQRVLAALFFAFIIGYPLGLLAGVNHLADRIISPLVYFFFPLPKIVFLPVFFVMFGINETTRIVLLVFIVIFQVIVNIRDGIKNIAPEYLELYFALGAGRKEQFKMYGYFALPALFSALRVSVGMVIAVLFITENFIADRGLGYLIFHNLELRNYPEMYSAIVLLSMLGYLLYAVTDFLERKICFWQKSMLE